MRVPKINWKLAAERLRGWRKPDGARLLDRRQAVHLPDLGADADARDQLGESGELGGPDAQRGLELGGALFGEAELHGLRLGEPVAGNRHGAAVREPALDVVTDFTP